MTTTAKNDIYKYPDNLSFFLPILFTEGIINDINKYYILNNNPNADDPSLLAYNTNKALAFDAKTPKLNPKTIDTVYAIAIFYTNKNII